MKANGKKSKRVLWVSRHMPLPSQLAELRRLFGEDVVVDLETRAFASAEDIAEWVSGYDEAVVVAPLSAIAILVSKYGIQPLWAEMQVVDDPREAEVTVHGRHYVFKRFRRIAGITIEFEDL